MKRRAFIIVEAEVEVEVELEVAVYVSLVCRLQQILETRQFWLSSEGLENKALGKTSLKQYTTTLSISTAILWLHSTAILGYCGSHKCRHVSLQVHDSSSGP